MSLDDAVLSVLFILLFACCVALVVFVMMLANEYGRRKERRSR